MRVHLYLDEEDVNEMIWTYERKIRDIQATLSDENHGPAIRRSLEESIMRNHQFIDILRGSLRRAKEGQGGE